MNSKETLQQAGRRLNQIKLVSRAAKFLALGFLIFMGCNSVLILFSYVPNPSELFGFSKSVSRVEIQPPDAWAFCRFVVMLGFQVTLGVWYWKLSRLFHFYEQGVIFAADPICCIKVLGALFCVGGIFNTVWRMLPKLPPWAPPPGVTVTTGSVYRLGFFHCDFGTGIDFGLLLAGATIVLVAWIMDEGRKIQEEQELTV